ncbi:MAG TPA: class I SAM-dependent methyltransferase [Symbiobacteriaceae bacterium]|nr:class I SAM-dependent methyltransferase [Symbiobacteriaceae bacterium]
MNPPVAEVRITLFMTSTFLAPNYRAFVGRLGLTGGESVLDAGSGSGAISRYIARGLQAGGGQLTCLDISPGWMEVARKRLAGFQGVQYVQADVSEAILPESAYDRIVVHFVLHDIPTAGQARAAANLARALKPGGRIFIREPISPRHGMAPGRIDELMLAAGLKWISGDIEKVMTEAAYAAVFERMAN